MAKKSSIANTITIIVGTLTIIGMLFAGFLYLSSPSNKIDKLQESFDRLEKVVENLAERVRTNEKEIAIAKVERLNQTKYHETINQSLSAINSMLLARQHEH